MEKASCICSIFVALVLLCVRAVLLEQAHHLIGQSLLAHHLSSLLADYEGEGDDILLCQILKFLPRLVQCLEAYCAPA